MSLVPCYDLLGMMEILDCGRRLLEAPGEVWAISTPTMVMKSLPQVIWGRIRVFELVDVLLCLRLIEHTQFQFSESTMYTVMQRKRIIGRC